MGESLSNAWVGSIGDPKKADVRELRLSELLAIGAIDSADANLCRGRYAYDSVAWDTLLNACESAIRNDNS